MIDLTEILKDVPQGTELRCPMFKDPVTFHTVNTSALYPITVKTSVGELVYFSKEGYYSSATAPQNCMLYPPMMNSWHDVEYIPDGKLVVYERNGKIIQIGRAKGGFAWYQINVYWWYDLEVHKLNVDGLLYFHRQATEYRDICNLLRKEGYEMVGTELRKISKFREGDIIVHPIGIIAIYDHANFNNAIVYKAIRRINGEIVVKTGTGIGYTYECRLATEEEKNLFFNSLAEAGYAWDGNEVVPVFKKGDIIASADTISIVDHIENLSTIKNIIYHQACIDSLGKLHVETDIGSGIVKRNRLATNGEKARILRMLAEAGYEFDGVNVKPKQITFKHFEPVIVRDSSNQRWVGDFFQYMEGNVFVCSGSSWHFCLPYNDDTKHLIGTSMPAPKYYR